MADVATTYTRLLQHATTCETYYVRQHLDPLHASLEAARSQYDKTMADQKKWEELKAEIAMTLLFVAGSVAFAAAAPAAGAFFGATAVSASKKLGSTGTKMMNAINAFSKVPKEKSLIKVTWDKLSTDSMGLIKAQAINEAKKLSDGLGETTITKLHPRIIQAGAKAHLNRLYEHIRGVIKAIEAAPISDDLKMKFAQEVMKTPFMQKKGSLSKQMGVMTRRFELLLYMHYVLDRDYLRSQHTMVGPAGAHSYSTSGGRIPQMPKSTSYPTTTSSGGIYNKTTTSPAYEDVGNIIAARINLLYTQEFLPKKKNGVYEWIDDDWRVFSVNTNKAKLIEAQNVLEKLVNLTSYKQHIPVW